MNLKELSEHLGLSKTTVSRALNGFSDVSEDTRRRVEEAAPAAFLGEATLRQAARHPQWLRPAIFRRRYAPLHREAK